MMLHIFPTEVHIKNLPSELDMRLVIDDVFIDKTLHTKHYFKKVRVQAAYKNKLTSAVSLLGISAYTLVWGPYEKEHEAEQFLSHKMKNDLRFYEEIKIGACLPGDIYSFNCINQNTLKKEVVNILIYPGLNPNLPSANMLGYLGYDYKI